MEPDPRRRIRARRRVTLKRLGAYILIGVAALVVFDLLTTFRHEFRALDLTDAERAPTHNPTRLALQVAGYPNDDNTQPDQIRQDCASGRCIATITDNNLADDSVSASQTRIELNWTPQGWVIEWAGHRWQCQPGRGNPLFFGWQKTPCQ